MSSENDTIEKSIDSMQEQFEAMANDNFLLQETVRDLELALDSVDWRRLSVNAQQEFSREGIRQIAEISRLFFLKNPIIHRGVTVQSLYVWGQGWSVQAEDEDIQQVINDFLNDRKNQAELTSQQALKQKEVEQQTDANTFLVFFTNKSTGKVRVRSIPLDEISDIYCSPDDAKEPWYYKRAWTVEGFTEGGGIQTEQQFAYYPDWCYNPSVKPDKIGGIDVMWDSPIFHIKTGSFSNWKFGISEFYSALDWARAYKEFLEDFASIVRAHRRFAWDASVPGGKSAIAAAKAKFNTTVGSGTNNGYDTNPPPTTGSVFVHDPSAQLTPVRTAGATSSLDEGRRLALMAFAGMDLPETFFGDVSVGTLATARSLDRPTELGMRDRQMFWQHVFERIFDYVLIQSAKATSGVLRGKATVQEIRDGDGFEECLEWSADTNSHIDIDFPPIINEGLLEQVQAIVTGATLNGGQLSGTIDIINLSRMILSALGEDDIDDIIETNFPDGQIPDWANPEKRAEMAAQLQQGQQGEEGDDDTRQAVEALRRKLISVWESKK